MSGNSYLPPKFPNAISRFSDCVSDLLNDDLGLEGSFTDKFMLNAVHRFHEQGEAGFDGLASDLRSTGIRTLWNSALGDARSETLANWIYPHIAGNVLDLLCGNGKVGEALARKGVNVTFAERKDAYDCGREMHRDRFIPLESLEDLSGHKYGTVLIATVLHHEKVPDALLAMAARLAEHHLIIVENCLEQKFPLEYHMMVDVFFNRCLNMTTLESPGEHRTAGDWVRAAVPYGELIFVDRKDRIPGVPLSHHLIVIKKNQERSP